MAQEQRLEILNNLALAFDPRFSTVIESQRRQKEMARQQAEEKTLVDFLRQNNPSIPQNITTAESALGIDKFLRQRDQQAATAGIYDNADYLQRGGTAGPELIAEMRRQNPLADSKALFTEAATLDKFLRPQNEIDYEIKADENGNLQYIPKRPGPVIPVGVKQAQTKTAETPYYTPVQSSAGFYTFDNRTGKYTPWEGNGGAPVLPVPADPNLKREITRAGAEGQIEGETTTNARIELPSYVQEAENTIKLVDELLAHPGFKQAVGKSSLLGIQNISGTKAKAFMIRQDQLKGKQFLQAFESLKGGGQITQIEGEKATDAISRMNNASTEEEYVTAAREFQEIIRQGVKRAKEKAGGAAPRGASGGWDSPTVGTIEDGFRFKGGNPSDPNNWERAQ